MKSPRNKPDTRSSGRRGMALLVAIACVAIASLISVSLLRLAFAQEDAVRADARQLQADWLAESAVDRAASRLRADPAYPGEKWSLPASLISGSDDALIAITIEPISGRSGLRRITVQVDYPPEAEFRTRRSKSVSYNLGR